MDLKALPQNFREEEKLLKAKGIYSWSSIKDLSEKDLNKFVNDSHASNRNLKRLRCIAMFICEINLTQQEAALVMHAGVPSLKALASLTPQELITKTGRLERQLYAGRNPILSLPRAHSLIQRAKNRQIIN